MTKKLTSELVAKPTHDLLEIARRAVSVDEDGNMHVDAAGAAALGDASLEIGWHDDRVMALVLGQNLDLDVTDDRSVWGWEVVWQRECIAAANEPATAQRFIGCRTWARAAYAVLLLSDWPASTYRGVGLHDMVRASRAIAGSPPTFWTRSPLPLIRTWAWRLEEAYLRHALEISFAGLESSERVPGTYVEISFPAPTGAKAHLHVSPSTPSKKKRTP